MDFGHVAPALPQNGLRSEKCLFWHHGRSQQTQITNTHIGGCGFESRCALAIFCWLLVLWGASRSARKKASCARPHWRKLRVWGLAAGRLFFPIFFDACFAVYNARRLLGSKTWISATSHRQGPRMVSEARNACFGITGARNRPIPTLLPSETCTQTPLNRPRMLFRRDPDFADAPETAQNDGFRRQFAAARFFANPFTQSCDHRPKASFASIGWLRNAAALACCFAPQGHFFGLETGTYGHHRVRADALDTQIGAQNPQLVGSQAPRPL